jgi:hypothetical protein
VPGDESHRLHETIKVRNFIHVNLLIGTAVPRGGRPGRTPAGPAPVIVALPWILRPRGLARLHRILPETGRRMARRHRSGGGSRLGGGGSPHPESGPRGRPIRSLIAFNEMEPSSESHLPAPGVRVFPARSRVRGPRRASLIVRPDPDCGAGAGCDARVRAPSPKGL